MKERQERPIFFSILRASALREKRCSHCNRWFRMRLAMASAARRISGAAGLGPDEVSHVGQHRAFVEIIHQGLAQVGHDRLG